VELLAFQDKSVPPETAPVLEFCARVVLVEKPRYREPRWSTLLPPDVCEFRSSAMRRAFGGGAASVRLRPSAGGVCAIGVVRKRRAGRARLHLRSVWPDRPPRRHALLGVGPLALAPDGAAGHHTLSVVMMWEKDAKLPVSVLSPNGPGTTCCSSVRSGTSRTWRRTGFSPSTSGPLLRDKFPEMRLTVVCGPDYLPYWHFGQPARAPVDERIRLLGLVADLRPISRKQPGAVAHDGLSWNEHQSAGGDGDRSCGGIRFLRVGRPRPDAWPQRVDRRHA
jgi:hypothetical protein